MTVSDAGMEWKLGKKTLWARFAHSIAAAGTSLGAGGQIAELSAGASEVHGASMDTADEVYFLVDPKGEDLGDADLTKDLSLELLFESAGGDQDTGVIWGADIKGIAAVEAIGDTKVAADGTIAFDAMTIDAPSKLNLTPRRGFKLASGALAADQLIGLAVTLTSRGDASADEIRLIAARLYFERQACSPSRVRETL